MIYAIITPLLRWMCKWGISIIFTNGYRSCIFVYVTWLECWKVQSNHRIVCTFPLIRRKIRRLLNKTLVVAESGNLMEDNFTLRVHKVLSYESRGTAVRSISYERKRLLKGYFVPIRCYNTISEQISQRENHIVL